MSKKIIIIGVAVLLVGGLIFWFFQESSKPLPGTKQADMGRKHVPAGSLQNAGGDMATSGDHYGDWIRAGVYETPLDDGNLIHSLEHGYVVLSYKCKVKSEKLDGTEATESGEQNRDEQCEETKNQLTKIYEKKGKRKLIIVPRPQMSTKITLYAWNYLLKLDQFDEERITQFINTYRDQGPERTME